MRLVPGRPSGPPYLHSVYSKLSDEQVDELLGCAQQSHPNVGIRMAKGLLQSTNSVV